MVRLTASEDKRVYLLCIRAWNELLINRNPRLWVTVDDLLLLLKAGGILLYHRQTTIPPKGRKKKKKKPKVVWQAEVEYNGHTFFHEEENYFFVPRPKKRPRLPWSP